MKTKNITYWIATLVFCGFMDFSAFSCLTRDPEMMRAFARLGYPDYLPAILGMAEILGIFALVAPGLPRLKEWAYAGFVFTLVGAACSHLAVNQDNAVIMPAANLLVLVISYACRPATRRLTLESEAEVHPTLARGSTIR